MEKVGIFRYLRHNENFAITFIFFEWTDVWTKYPKYSAF